MMKNLQGQVVMIVGAGRGIGRRAAELFREAGAHLVIASRDSAELGELEYKLNHKPPVRVDGGGGQAADAPPGVLALTTDATDSRAVARLVEAATDRFGRIDVLVYSAGTGVLKPFAETTDDEFVRLMNTNARGAFLVLKAVLPIMEGQKGGHVIALPGILGRAPMAQAAVYAASKYALTGMLKCLALEYKRAGVRISLLHLGGVDSSFWDTITMRVQRDRMLSIDSAARAVVFAATQDDGGVLGELVLQPESHQM